MMQVLMIIVAFYLAAGLIIALLFVFSWVEQLDEQAKGAPLSFRLLLIPASTMLWPYLLMRHLNKKQSS
ncbi:MAG: hypothetical protein K1X61_10015 [Chitinophagales bacterium]|nr:hypothetical protein [Chitinophagales bacterium]